MTQDERLERLLDGLSPDGEALLVGILPKPALVGPRNIRLRRLRRRHYAAARGAVLEMAGALRRAIGQIEDPRETGLRRDLIRAVRLGGADLEARRLRDIVDR